MKKELVQKRDTKVKSSNGAGGRVTTDKRARLPVSKTYKLYIGGAFPRSESGRYIRWEGEEQIVNVSRASRKDFRNAVVAARKALPSWSARTAYNRGQIVYRMAEMLESRQAQFVSELMAAGSSRADSQQEVHAAIDRIIYYAGWSDKYQQLFSSVNPVSGSYFNFSVPEPTGVVAVMSPDHPSLLGLISHILPAIVGANTCVVLASETEPLTSISLAEVFQTSDLPGGVVNVLTGYRSELLPHMSSHMDVNALVVPELSTEDMKQIGQLAAENVKRLIVREGDVTHVASAGPYQILETQEIKTTWHPIGK